MTPSDFPAADVQSAPSAAGNTTELGHVLTAILRMEPVAKGRARAGNGTHYTPPRTREAENTAAVFLKAAMRGGQPYTGRLAVRLHFVCSTRRKCDIDNLAKLVLDAGNGIVWAGDHLIDRLELSRVQGVKPPSVRVEVDVLGDAA